MIRYFKKSLLVFLAVMMVITFMPNLGVAERAYADDKDGGMIQMDTPVTVSGNAGDRTVLTFETGDEFTRQQSSLPRSLRLQLSPARPSWVQSLSSQCFHIQQREAQRAR